MTDSTVASNVTGTVGTVCWSIQLIPQIIYNYLRKDCTGLPPLMMFLWAACGIPFSIYFFITQPSIAVQVQPEIFTVLCSISFCQSIYYPPIKMNKLKILAIMCVFYSIAIGSELGFILWLRPVYQHGTTWPSLIFGIMASVMLAAGLVPPYFELAKRKGRVVGINFIFLAIDCSGAIFSMVSLLTGGMDITGMVLYCICITMEIGIFVSHFIWYIRFRKKLQLGTTKAQIL
ncbi:hypothetical protein PACTADRAFT_86598 [Pachysolen tannophilus NRRL Y-2460]|uniref:Uncharacterized protein n=1 Tax=Pachysolen tannophilus NRRL Y-2460 TaxID=669874 RepID=A0A1E4TRP7_PACTA|nr:hypothetical protein PACTADRAFT_86598 [Pachysolen tannophilus NRRL Y-2460]